MSLSYESAGVSISKGNAWVEMIKGLLRERPVSPRVIGGIGGFSGLYSLTEDLYLAACCDGVGTKMELAKAWHRMEGLGQDLVAMNVNDLVTCGAKPLFFLDYLACGALDAERYRPVMKSIIEACEACDCALLGGETAEMPGVYSPEGFDLAGFSVGVVSREKLITGESVVPGDLLVGLPSSGVHSNGFSLVRKALEGVEKAQELIIPGEEAPLKDLLLRPTLLYVRTCLEVQKQVSLKAMAHITGGGLEENIARICHGNLPQIDYSAWERPPLFQWLASRGIPEKEMRSVFNLGMGFVFVCSPEEGEKLLKVLEELGEKPRIIGKVLQNTSH
jgi:phosphoribosylformylglycinamidine cyclo-ligase